MLLTVDGHQVFAATGGRIFDPALPTVVFLHGAGCDRTGWMQQARWFAHHGWSVLAPDLPGHGRSKGQALASIAAMVAWTRQLLDAADVSRAALVGHSMGGAIALEAAATLGDKITHLGLIGTAAAIPVGAALLTAARESPSDAYGMMTTWALSTAARNGRSAVPGTSLAGAVRSVFNSQTPKVLATDLAACAAWTTGPAAAANVRCPTIVIAGALDIMTSPKRGQDLAKAIAGASFTLLPTTGHMIMQEAPDACLAALRRGLSPTHQAA
jgi:pimeloyl-ACP methyl ester carboxylesterase